MHTIEPSTLEADSRLPAPAHAALSAALVTAAGSSLGDHLQLLLAVPVTVAGFALACVAAARTSRARPERTFAWIDFALAAMVGVTVAAGPPSHSATWYRAAYWSYCIIALAAVAAVAGGGSRLRRRAVWIAVGCGVVLHLATPLAAPRPTIDVWTWNDTCVRAMLHGIHPYTVRAIDAERGAHDFGYVEAVYQYMPLVLVANAPATALLGDYRCGLALCLPLAIVLFRAAGRRLQVADRLLDTATLALLLHPSSVYMVSLGWTEPWLVLVLTIFLWRAAAARDRFGQAVAFMLLPALKQYVVAPALMFVAMTRRWRAAAVGIAVLAATIAPFVMLNWRATVDGMLFPLRGSMPFREDSNSIAAFVYHFTGMEPAHWLGPAAQIIVGAVAYLRLRREGLGGLLLGSALAIFASLLVGMQAFANYYYFVSALLICSALAFGRRSESA